MEDRISAMERRVDLAVRALKGEFKRDGGPAEFHRLWAEAGDSPVLADRTVIGGLRESGPS